MSSVAAAADTPEEFAALANYTVEHVFMSEAASEVEVFATTEGHRDVSTRDPQAHDRVRSRVARLPRRVLRCLLGAAGFKEPVWLQTRIRRATTASLAEEVGEWYRSGSGARHRSASSKRRSPRTRRRSSRSKRYGAWPSSNRRTSCRTSSEPSTCTG